MTTLAILKLIKETPKIHNIDSIKYIHRILFEKVYDWAGEYRTINIYKHEPLLNGLSVPYTPVTQIKQGLMELNEFFDLQKWVGLNRKAVAKKITLLISKLWKIHPYR